MPLLSWHGRDADLARAQETPYRLLEPVAGLSYGEADSPNMLIEGDNLDALKALLPYYAGQVKCVFIDPPYNTRSSFEHYDDNLEHSQWLSMMYPRLELLRELLAEDGSIWISIDDNEQAYLRVVMDHLFGRKNFVATVIWQKVFAPKNTARHFSEDHDFIMVFAKNGEKWSPNPMARTEKQDRAYKNPDKDPRGPWKPGDVAARNYYSKGTYPIRCPGGRLIEGPRPGTYWRVAEEKFWELHRDNRIWWGSDQNRLPMIKRFKSEVMAGRVPQTLWPYEEVGHTKEAKEEVNTVVQSAELVFQTPKPERLLKRVIEIASNPSDLVLDSFLGSGTTAAVAQKMNRHWIGIEMGAHAHTHCQPRLQKVIEGEQGGISEAVGWKGGRGFQYYRLGDTVFDETGKIRDSISFERLAAHIWFVETRTAYPTGTRGSAFLGSHAGTGYYLLHGEVLGPLATNGTNVLTRRVLRILPKHDGPKVIYAEACDLPTELLREQKITFRQTPYDIRAR